MRTDIFPVDEIPHELLDRPSVSKTEAWAAGYAAGYKAALQSVRTVQLTLDVNANE